MILSNKTILITGASSGIGRELALQLAAKGNRIILIARRENMLQQLTQEIMPHAQEHIYFSCDVSQAGQVQEVCDKILAAGIQVDVLILNAGISGGFDAANIDLDAFHQIVNVNLFGVVYFVKHLAPQMIARRDGLIVAVGSLAGYRGMPGAAPYSAAKGALMNFIDSLRVDLYKHNVRCTLVSPGFVETPMTDKNEFVMPFMIPVAKAARIIIRGLEAGKPEIRFPFWITCAARIGRLLPDQFYARLMQNRRKRRRI